MSQHPSSEQIARDLLEQARKTYGEERAKVLRAEIEETAKRLAIIQRYRLPVEGDEPDFLPAQTPEWDTE